MNPHTHIRALALTLRALIPLIYMWYTPAQAQTNIAVLDIKIAQQPNTKPIDRFSAQSITEDLRKLALDLNAYTVITKENIDILLPPDTKLEDCVGTCEVDIGKKIGAHYIITAEIGNIGNTLETIIRLYDTKSGSLIEQLNISAQNIPTLKQKIQTQGPSLFSKLATRDLPTTDN